MAIACVCARLHKRYPLRPEGGMGPLELKSQTVVCRNKSGGAASRAPGRPHG